MLHDIKLLTPDLSLFGDAPAAGEGGAPAAAESTAAPETHCGGQTGTTDAPQQTTCDPAPDKGKAFRALIRGEYRDQYADETRKLINRRFRETDARMASMQPIIDMLDARYGTEGDMAKLMDAVEGDAAYWQAAADAAGMSVEAYRTMLRLDRHDRARIAAQRAQRTQYMAAARCEQWQAEAEALRGKYPQFDLETMLDDGLFTLMLRNDYPMEQAYKACKPDELAAQAAASAEKAVTDHIRARGGRPAEAGANPSPAFAVKEDVTKLSDRDVLRILGRIGSGSRVSFG